MINSFKGIKLSSSLQRGSDEANSVRTGFEDWNVIIISKVVKPECQLSKKHSGVECGGWFIRSDITKGVNRSADVSGLIVQHLSNQSLPNEKFT